MKLMGGPSRHLMWAELACHDGTPYPEAWQTTRAMLLARAFEAIRAEWSLPIAVLSAYRTPTYNAKIGGAKNSQHVQGRALDLAPPEGVSVYDFWTRIVEIAQKAGIGGVGYAPPSEGGYVHVDIRPMPDGRLAQWRYPIGQESVAA